MKTKTSIKQYGIAVVIALALVLGVSTLEAAGWSAPSGSPPSGNVDAPVNIGLNTQSKLGQLILNSSVTNPYTVGLQVFGNSVFNGSLQIADGTQGAGKVLTSDASGNASWGAGGSSGSGAVLTSNPIPDYTHVDYGTITLANPLGVQPSQARLVLVNLSPECGYNTGDEVDAGSAMGGGASNLNDNVITNFSLATNPQNVYIVYNYNNQRAANNAYLITRSASCNYTFLITPAKWGFKVYLNGGSGSGSGVSIIKCSNTSIPVGAGTWSSYSWTASDCGGTLPTSGYVGSLAGWSFPVSSQTATRIINPGGTNQSGTTLTNGGVDFWAQSGGNGEVRAVYIK